MGYGYVGLSGHFGGLTPPPVGTCFGSRCFVAAVPERTAGDEVLRATETETAAGAWVPRQSTLALKNEKPRRNPAWKPGATDLCSEESARRGNRASRLELSTSAHCDLCAHPIERRRQAAEIAQRASASKKTHAIKTARYNPTSRLLRTATSARVQSNGGVKPPKWPNGPRYPQPWVGARGACGYPGFPPSPHD